MSEIAFGKEVPSTMGGDMPKEDYLVNMSLESAPKNYLAMGFGESSSYADLAEPCYRGEVCIIGSQEIPDPLLALFVQKERGKARASRLIDNIAGFGAPVNAIRHIGKPSNTFGSVFVMPLFFAEPFILFSQDDDENSTFVREFLASAEFEAAFAEKHFLVSNEKNDKLIFPACAEPYFPEVEEIYSILKKKLDKKKLA